MSRLRVLVSGSYMEFQSNANQEPFVQFGIVPIPVIATIEINARLRTSVGLPLGGTAARSGDSATKAVGVGYVRDFVGPMEAAWR
jgi:hypothetical protein